MRRWILLAALAAATLILLAPSAPAAQGANVWVTTGIPVKLAGTADLAAPEATLVLRGGGHGDARLDAEGAHVEIITITTHLMPTPAGTSVPVEQLRSQESHLLPAGAILFTPDEQVLRLVADASDVRALSQAAEATPRDAWAGANAQLTTTLAPETIRPAGLPSMPADATAAPYDTRTLDAGIPLFRTDTVEATAAAHDVALFAGILEADGLSVTAGSTTATVAGSIWSPGGQWVGPGTHQETTTVYVLVQPVAGRLAAVADGLLLDVAATSFRLHHDGLVQFPWAQGVVDRDGHTQTLSGEQVLLGGQVTWTPVDTDVQGAPQIRLAGQGVVDYFHIGALPPPLSTTEKAAMAGGAAVTAGAVAAAVWYWPVIKFTASGLFAGLYARVPKDRVLQHKGREHVYELIKGEPGISTNRLADDVDFGWSTLTYHLRVLERTEKIVSVRDGRHKRFFDRESGRFANGRKHLVSVLKNESTLDIAKFILKQPGVTQKDVGEAFGLAPSSVHWHVTRLTEAELITKERDRHRVRYFPGDNWHKISAKDVGLEESLLPEQAPGGPDGAVNA